MLILKKSILFYKFMKTFNLMKYFQINLNIKKIIKI
jgi:hypothetical protein